MADDLINGAESAGAAAGRRGRPITDCPFNPASDDPKQRAAALAWVRGYQSTADVPVDDTP